MWVYDNLSNKEIDNIRESYLGFVLKPIREIGREAVVRELREFDAYQLMKKKYPNFGVANTKKKEKELENLKRYVLWKTSKLQFIITLKEFMKIKKGRAR